MPSSPLTSKRFGQMIGRVIAIGLVLGMTTWLLLSPDSPYRLTSERESNEQDVGASSKRLRPLESAYAFANDGQWGFDDLPWAVGTQEIASADDAMRLFHDDSRLPRSSSLAEPDETIKSLIALCDDEATRVTRFENYDRKDLEFGETKMALFTTHEGNFLTFRMLLPIKDEFNLVSMTARTEVMVDDQGDFIRIPADLKVLGSRRDAKGIVSAKFLSADISLQQLLAHWVRDGWVVTPDMESENQFYVRRDNQAFSVTLANDASNIIVIRLAG